MITEVNPFPVRYLYMCHQFAAKVDASILVHSEREK